MALPTDARVAASPRAFRARPVRDARAAAYRRATAHAAACLRAGRVEDSLRYAQAAARYAWLNHFGLWHDDELETLVSSAGRAVCGPTAQVPRPPAASKQVFLYVATALAGTGGHSEVMRQWMTLLARPSHRRQYFIATASAAPGFVARAREAGGIHLSLDGETLSERIRSLVRRGTEMAPDHIFLFANPDDVVAIAAVGALKARCASRVILCDHAGFAFWLGTQLPDVLVALAPSLAGLPRTVRGYRGDVTVVPLTTDAGEDCGPACAEAARPSAGTVSLSIGSPWKLMPDDQWDYFAAIRTLLERNPTHTHVLLTLPHRGITQRLRRWPSSLRGRLEVRYGIVDLPPYYRRADVLIETCPFSGGQVRTEAMAFGLPIVFIDNRRFPLALAHEGIESAAASAPFIARGNADVVDRVERLLRDPAARRLYGAELRAMFLRECSPEQVRLKLERLVETDRPTPSGAEAEPDRPPLDDDYLVSSTLSADRDASPFVIVLRDALRGGTPRARLLLDCLRCLSPRDWWSVLRRFARLWPHLTGAP